ncbi:MAG: hypothetical protein IJI49_00160 [Bacilli bacterium]|nr:hypothetical protein [Bacilli bacterium]
MLGNYNFYSYYSISSKIHRLSSLYKIISILILIISLFFCNSIIDLLIINLYIFVIMYWSNISFKLYYNNLKVFRYILLIIFIFVSLISFNIITGIIWTIKIFDLLIYLVIINITTSLNDLVSGFYRFFKPFIGLYDINNLSLNSALLFKYFGVCYSEYNRIKISQRIRGIKYSDMNIIDKIKYIIYDIKPVLRRTSDTNALYKKNMYIRDYGVSSYISNYRLNKWRLIDTMLLVVNILVLIVSVIY